jgi:hypothetical protein
LYTLSKLVVAEVAKSQHDWNVLMIEKRKGEGKIILDLYSVNAET